MGRKELTELMNEQKNTEITCQFCDKVYSFTSDEIGELLDKI